MDKKPKQLDSVLCVDMDMFLYVRTGRDESEWMDIVNIMFAKYPTASNLVILTTDEEERMKEYAI